MDKAIELAIRMHSDALIALPGVEGLGQGLCDGEPCIRGFVANAAPEGVRQVREVLQGVPVDIEETGEFRAHTW